MMAYRLAGVVAGILAAATLVGCQTKAGTGALVGGAGGAAIGGLIGSNSHGRAGEGALIGAAVGAIGGALVGHAMDKNDEQERQDTLQTRDYRNPRTTATDNRSITKEDVIAWSSRGTRDDIIIDRIDRSSTVFHLTAADENQLRDAGVSEEVIRAMRDTARR